MIDNIVASSGVYHIQQLQEAEPEVWLDLCRAATQAQRQIRMESQTTGHSCLTICEHSGNTPLRFDDSLIGLGVISFNGCRARQQAGDAFILTRGMRQITEYCCNTDNQPYSFLVRVMLLLANHYCPGTWQFITDILESDWIHSAGWITQYLNITLSPLNPPSQIYPFSE
ncbi:hypothetical protein [Ewingella americana]|jgi:hypothetical protein|uniref:Uncharacterized protein n=1 Tax=Ewingella americana TaxID=41202 RepID=A0A502GQ78_9GAMM|nr:hypothetical protein [Ewingella americana]TPG63146.1 hypothetical protein EAH77_06060 [Ewingella americana]